MTSGRNDEKIRPSHTDVIFVVMDALVNVLVDELFTFYCHETGDCNAVATRASSELSQSAECQSVRSHIGVSYSNRLVIANRNAHALWSELQ